MCAARSGTDARQATTTAAAVQRQQRAPRVTRACGCSIRNSSSSALSEGAKRLRLADPLLGAFGVAGAGGLVGGSSARAAGSRLPACPWTSSGLRARGGAREIGGDGLGGGAAASAAGTAGIGAHCCVARFFALAFAAARASAVIDVSMSYAAFTSLNLSVAASVGAPPSSSRARSGCQRRASAL